VTPYYANIKHQNISVIKTQGLRYSNEEEQLPIHGFVVSICKELKLLLYIITGQLKKN